MQIMDILLHQKDDTKDGSSAKCVLLPQIQTHDDPCISSSRQGGIIGFCKFIGVP